MEIVLAIPPSQLPATGQGSGSDRSTATTGEQFVSLLGLMLAEHKVTTPSPTTAPNPAAATGTDDLWHTAMAAMFANPPPLIPLPLPAADEFALQPGPLAAGIPPVAITETQFYMPLSDDMANQLTLKTSGQPQPAAEPLPTAETLEAYTPKLSVVTASLSSLPQEFSTAAAACIPERYAPRETAAVFSPLMNPAVITQTSVKQQPETFYSYSPQTGNAILKQSKPYLPFVDSTEVVIDLNQQTLRLKYASIDRIIPMQEQTPAQRQQNALDGKEMEEKMTSFLSMKEETSSDQLFALSSSSEHVYKPSSAGESKSAAAPQSQSTVNDKYDVINQIVQHTKLITRQHAAEIVVKLNPEHLGELTLKVAVEQGAVSATFHSGNAEVRSILEASLPHFKQEMSNQGIKLDNVGVFAGMDQFLSSDQRDNRQQHAYPELQLVRKIAPEFSETAINMAPNAASATGVDYRI